MKLIISVFLLSILVYILFKIGSEGFVSNENSSDEDVIKYILNYFLNFLDVFFSNLLEIRKLSNEIFKEMIRYQDRKSPFLKLARIENYKYKLLLFKRKFKIDYSDKKLEGIFFSKNLLKREKVMSTINSFECNSSNNGLTQIQILSKNLYCSTKKIIKELISIYDNYIKLYDSDSYDKFQGSNIDDIIFKNVDDIEKSKIIQQDNFKYLLTSIKLNYLDVLQTNKLHIKNAINEIDVLVQYVKDAPLKDVFKNNLIKLFDNRVRNTNNVTLYKTLNLAFVQSYKYHIFNVINNILNDSYKINRSKKSQILKRLRRINKIIDIFVSKRVKVIHRIVNNKSIFKAQDNYYKEMESNFDVESKFCKKLKLLNKPSDNIMKKSVYVNEVIDKKKEHVKYLENQIKELHKQITHNKLHEYNKYKLRTHVQAGKQIDAIKKTMDNIKNANTVKLNVI